MNSSNNLKRDLNLSDVYTFLDEIKSSTILILPHESPDLDAYASAYALRELLKRYFTERGKKDVYVVLPRLSTELKELVKELGLPDFKSETEFVFKNVFEKLDYDVILVDMTSVNRFSEPTLREVLDKAKKIFVIDHHKVNIDNAIALVLERTSTSEIILEIAEKIGLIEEILKNKKLVNALIAAIISDTSFFYFANETTFRNISILSKFGDYKKIYSAMKNTKKDFSERIARIKGAKRAEMFRIDDKIVLITRVNSHEASVASSLINLGANIGIVISKKKTKGKKQYRVIGRSTGFNLAKFFMNLAEELGGSGGGHPTAAGLVLDADSVKDEIELSKLIIRKLIEYV